MLKKIFRRKNATRYYLILIAFLFCFFFSNDFGLIDIQKTAIVIAAAIDRDGEEFVLTSQIAVPQASKQGEQVQPVQIESRGKTVAEAFSKVNAKTGWYPKLVFCNLIVLGKTAVERDVFEGLDFFLRDEYMADNCSLAVTEGDAKEILSSKTPIEEIPALAVQKVLSEHAARVGTALPVTLRTFSASHYSSAKSGFIPILKKEQASGESSSSHGQGGGQSGSQSQSQNQSQSGGKNQGESKETVFSASETALFKEGVMVGKLNEEQTFALAAVKRDLRLAGFFTGEAGNNYTLLVKKNENKIRLTVDKNAQPKLFVQATVIAGIQDNSSPSTVTELAEEGSLPPAVKKAAEEKLKKTVEDVFQIAKDCGADVFGATEMLRKYQSKYFSTYHDDLLSRIKLSVKIQFRALR